MPRFSIFNKGLNKSALEALKAAQRQEAELAAQAASHANLSGGFNTLESQLKAAGAVDELGNINPELLTKEIPSYKPDFELVGDPYSKDFTLGPDTGKGGFPAKIKEPEIVEAIPEKNLPAPISKVDDVIDITPEAIDPSKMTPDELSRIQKVKNWIKENPKKTIAGVAGAAYLGNELMSDDKQSPIMASTLPTGNENEDLFSRVHNKYQELNKIKQPNEQIDQSAAIQQDIPTQDVEQSPDKMKALYEQLMNVNFGDSNINEVERLKEAQARADKQVLANNLLKASQMFLGGASGVKQDSSMYDDAIKRSGDIVTNEKQIIDAEKNDPNSPRSKGYKDIMKKLGYNIQGSTSASDLEKVMPQLVNLYAAEEARKSREDIAKQEADAKKEALVQKAADKEEADQKDKEKFTRDLRKELTSGEMKELYSAYQKSDQAVQRIKDAIAKPSGYKDLGNLYGYLKSLDSNSAVREGELSLGIKQGSIPEKLHASFLQFMTGEMVSPEQRKKMAEVIVGYANQNRNAYNTAIQPILEQADELKIPRSKLMRDIKTEDYKLNDISPSKKQAVKLPEAVQAPKVSPQTVDLINSRSDEENKKRLQELKAKYGRK